MQHVGGNVGPELAKDVGEGIAPDGVSVLDRQLFAGAVLTGIVAERDALSDGAAQQLRNIEAIVSVIIRGDKNPSGRVGATLPYPALAHGVVTLVLMKNRWQDKKHQVIAVGLIDKAAPVVLPEAAYAFAQLWMGIRAFRHGGVMPTKMNEE